MIEFLLATWGNVRGTLIVATICGIVSTVIFGIGWAMAVDFAKDFGGEKDKARVPRFRHAFRVVVTVTAVFAVFTCIPTLDDLWRIRIALVKYELASPENVQKATETIERIGKKLECKYLGGESCKE